MKTKILPVATCLVILAISIYVGFSIGLALPGAAVFAALVAAPYTWVVVLCGPKTLALPMSGLAIGFAVLLIGRLLAGGVSFAVEYYVFGPALAVCAVALVGSVLLLAAPGLRTRLFGSRARADRGGE
jgi:hypothetical protein